MAGRCGLLCRGGFWTYCSKFGYGSRWPVSLAAELVLDSPVFGDWRFLDSVLALEIGEDIESLVWPPEVASGSGSAVVGSRSNTGAQILVDIVVRVVIREGLTTELAIIDPDEEFLLNYLKGSYSVNGLPTSSHETWVEICSSWVGSSIYDGYGLLV
jgi:hypothetical protein